MSNFESEGDKIFMVLSQNQVQKKSEIYVVYISRRDFGAHPLQNLELQVRVCWRGEPRLFDRLKIDGFRI
jgi:hypothetical protein